CKTFLSTLELHADAQLKLPGRIGEVAVSAVRDAEGGAVEVKAWSSGAAAGPRGGNAISRGGDAGNVGMVGQVENIGQHFHAIAFLDLDGLGEPQVLHIGAGETEGVAPDSINAECAARAVHAASAGYATRSVAAG